LLSWHKLMQAVAFLTETDASCFFPYWNKCICRLILDKQVHLNFIFQTGAPFHSPCWSKYAFSVSSVETNKPSLSSPGWYIFSISCLTRWTNYNPGQSKSTIKISLPQRQHLIFHDGRGTTSHFVCQGRNNSSLTLTEQTPFPSFLLQTGTPLSHISCLSTYLDKPDVHSHYPYKTHDASSRFPCQQANCLLFSPQ
jgi:hypothetical protein